jgi:predicted Zn-dependent protease
VLLKFISFATVLVLLALAPTDGRAQSMEFIRDAEIENTIRLYANPLFQQAGVEPSAVTIHLVKDPQLNAFVAEGLNLFINTGLIERTQNAGQLIGVIAHETGHIAGGHLVRGRDAMENASSEALASMILGMAAAVAAKRGDLGSAIMMGGNDIAARSYLAFSRTIEGSADTAGLTFLDNLHLSAKGFLEFMETLGDQELLVTARQDPYVRTHPLTRDRIDEIRHHVEQSPWSDTPVPPAYVEPHHRIVAKLAAFMDPPATTLYHYKESDTSLWARYARAIAYYRIPDLAHAVPLIDGLIAERPKDPYFHELKGQMLFENGRAKEAVPEYQLAVKYLPDNALLQQELGQVEVEADDPALLPQAKEHLTIATQREADDPGTWRLLATAYGRMGDETMAAASMAEYALLTGRYEEAIFDAVKALQKLKKGTPVELRMQDIRAQAEQAREAAKKRRG